MRGRLGTGLLLVLEEHQQSSVLPHKVPRPARYPRLNPRRQPLHTPPTAPTRRHRLLLFRGQGLVPGERMVEISHWFGELESTFYKHPRSPHPDVFRVSNVRSEGCTGAVPEWAERDRVSQKRLHLCIPLKEVHSTPPSWLSRKLAAGTDTPVCVSAGVGRTGWHLDGSFMAEPFAFALYHMVAVPKTVRGQGRERLLPVMLQLQQAQKF